VGDKVDIGTVALPQFRVAGASITAVDAST
jgi:hypothetical protein